MHDTIRLIFGVIIILSQVVSRLCKQAGFGGLQTNHSLRKIVATKLFKEGINEQIIMEQTRIILHKELDCTRGMI